VREGFSVSNDDRNDNAAPDKNDVDEQLKQQLSSIWELRRECRLRPAWRVAQEARRLAKAESRLIPYLTANFNIINLARDVYEPGAGKDAAIETIALLESADRARNFQGDYDQREYDYTVGWMSACAYDNLATATGEISGYNSPGMQACIADGMDVCRRTGKLRCLACFREYATEVFRAADDLDMALHHARTNAIAKIDERGDDRRWVGASDEAGLLLLAGQLQPAWEAALRADILATKYHSPARALRKQAALKRTIATVWGRDDLLTSIQCDAPELPVDEDPEHDLRLALLDAITAACRGDFAGAVKVLTRWDKLLSDRQYVHKWFDVRLHLIAAYRMAGQNDRAAALAKPLKTKATAAQDYLTCTGWRGSKTRRCP
jgi:hypothetical protein